MEFVIVVIIARLPLFFLLCSLFPFSFGPLEVCSSLFPSFFFYIAPHAIHTKVNDYSHFCSTPTSSASDVSAAAMQTLVCLPMSRAILNQIMLFLQLRNQRSASIGGGHPVSDHLLRISFILVIILLNSRWVVWSSFRILEMIVWKGNQIFTTSLRL